MRLVWQLVLCCALTAGTMSAQRGGGGARGGGFGDGVQGNGFGGGFRGGIGGGVFRDGGFGGSRGGFGFRGGFGRFGFFNRGFYPYYGFGFWPYVGFGYADYWPYGYAYDSSPGYYPMTTDTPYINLPRNVTLVYPPSGAGSSVTRLYDQYGQEVPNASPLYLIAFNDRTIRAALSYRVDGNTLRYVTMDHEDKEAPLNTVDSAFSLQLNRERRVPLQLP